MCPALPAVAVCGVILAGCSPAAFEVALTPPADATFGDGRLGPLEVTSPGTEINACHPVISASNGSLSLVSGIIDDGTAVIVWQVQDAVASVSTSAEISAATTGLWERSRIETHTGNAYTLATPITGDYGSGGARRAQVCTLPEHTNVTIAAGASIAASPWNGASGGFAGFLAREIVTIDGTVEAIGAGFRGTEPLGNDGGTDETALINTNQGQAGGIGEGINASLLGLAGRGAAGNGGGGGGAFNAGGGGGGNGGRGGEGATQTGAGTLDTSGLGGSALMDADGRFAFGGGGGSGHQDQFLAGAGGNGGGVIWMRAYILRGGGVFDASGADGSDSDIADTLSDGAGGGGAGGSIILESEYWEFDGTVRATGGRGGSVDRSMKRGLGGGGGGGRAVLPPGVELVPVLTGGAPGVNSDGSSLDATAGEPAQ